LTQAPLTQRKPALQTHGVGPGFFAVRGSAFAMQLRLPPSGYCADAAPTYATRAMPAKMMRMIFVLTQKSAPSALIATLKKL
jgi:hypothetical protein